MEKHPPEMEIGFTEELLPDCNHLCLIYDDEAERQKIVSAYLAAGLKQGNIVRYFADTTTPEQVSAWLAELGVAPPKEDGFRIVSAEASYCAGGRFVPQQVIDNAVARYDTARAAGYTGSRVTGEMSWVLRGIPGAERFLEYEIGLNQIENDYPRIGMCQYDARLFDGATLFQVLQVHPYMVAHGQIVKNPFYLTPAEFQAQRRTKI